MAIFTATLIQGAGNTFVVTLNPPAAFQGTENLAASVSSGGTATAITTTTPTWASGQTAGAYTIVNLPFTATQAAALAPGYYVVIITLADSTAPLAWGLLEVVSGPSASPNPVQDFLVTPAEVLGLVPDLCAAGYLADLPRVITSATQAIRKYCSRNFTRTTMTKEFYPNYQGQIRLDEIPVNEVIRIATGRDAALWIVGPSNAQIANVRFAYTGDYDSGIVNTGLILTSTASAITTTTTLLFATYTTIQALATAINAVSGWTTQVGNTYGLWPSTELVGADSAQGALVGSGCRLDVYSQDAALERLDANTGMIWLGGGIYGSNLNTPAWGPDWMQFLPSQQSPQRVKVTYDAGFTTIPSPVVMAAIETIQAAFARLTTDQIIKSETADAYSYQLRDQLDFIPDAAKHALATYRIFNA